MRRLIVLTAVLATVLISCKDVEEPVASLGQLKEILPVQPSLEDWMKQDLEFWEQKVLNSPEQFPFKAKLASSYGRSFGHTRNYEQLFKAGALWDEVNAMTGFSKAAYLRAAAKNAITRHEFQPAYELLKKAETLKEGLTATQLMLFDVTMELASFNEAETYLKATEDYSDVDYLIRLAKWHDHSGELPQAIARLEQVYQWAKDRKNADLEFWAISNLGDYYGHAGKIKRSYEAYLKALVLNPSSSYVKKGIAYIAFAHDNQPLEALQIIEAIPMADEDPDLLLLKADILDYLESPSAKANVLDRFVDLVNMRGLQTLYRLPLAMIYAEEFQDFDTALTLAKQEVTARATPETYDALAWIYYLAGDLQSALKITKEEVWNRSFEPVLLMHSAIILNGADQLSEKEEVKTELLEAAFELGPLAMEQVSAL